MFNLANPRVFLNKTNKLAPALLVISLISLFVGLYFALFASPADYQHMDLVRIMYVHVPSAWMSLFCYVASGAFAISYLVWRIELADIIMSALLRIGTLFTFLCIVTGMLWGKPAWGALWVWDARLTSVFILFIIYIGQIYIRTYFRPVNRAKFIAAVFNLIGLVNIPIIKFSVEWWNTLHQPASVMRSEGIAIHPDMQFPLIIIFISYLLLCASLVIYQTNTAILIIKRKSSAH